MLFSLEHKTTRVSRVVLCCAEAGAAVAAIATRKQAHYQPFLGNYSGKFQPFIVAQNGGFSTSARDFLWWLGQEACKNVEWAAPSFVTHWSRRIAFTSLRTGAQMVVERLRWAGRSVSHLAPGIFQDPRFVESGSGIPGGWDFGSD